MELIFRRPVLIGRPFFLYGFQAFGRECNTKAEVSLCGLPDRERQRPTGMGAWATAKMRRGDPGHFHGRPGSAREQIWVCPRADMGLS